MFKQILPIPVTKNLKPIFLASLLVMGVAAFVVIFPARTQKLSAATSSTINFQARLLTAAGSIVPDGDYHVEFKLYNAATSTGTPNQGACTMTPGSTADPACLWTETRTTGNLVRVVNGYLTVNLGSVTAFPGTVDWDQELWMSMRIGGAAGSAAWETTEMTPRLKLTAVPYAFRAGALMGGTGANTTKLTTGTPSGNNTISLPAETGVVCLQSSTNCGFAAGSGSGNYIQNQTGGQQASSNFWISGTGRADTSFSTTLLTTASGDLNIDPTGNTVIKGSVATNASAALHAQNSSSTTLLFVRNDGNVGVGTASPAASLDVGGFSTLLSGMNAKVTVAANTNDINGVQMYNASSGAAADFRFSVADNAKDQYLSFSMPSTGNTATLFGQTRSGIATIFLNSLGAGADRLLAIGTVHNTDVLFGTNNTERMRILNGGNVGINVNNPGSRLVVQGSTSDNTASALNITNSGAGSLLYVRNDGNVGIGTTAPGSPLHVVKATGGGTIGFFRDDANTVDLSVGGEAGSAYLRTGSGEGLRLASNDSANPHIFIDTAGEVGIGTATPNTRLEVNSGTGGTSGVRLTQLTSASGTSSSYSGILGVDSSGNIGLSTFTAPLASQALAYWDGINDPTTSGQAYPLAALSGSAAFDTGNGVRLTPATNNQSGSLGWIFGQQNFMRVQFKMRAGGGSGADGVWFYAYGDDIPPTEYAGGSGFTQGYIVYFSEYHDCAGISYGQFWDGEQCNDGGANQPLVAVSKGSIDDNNWHDVDISILQNKIIVRYDGVVLMSYDDVYTRDLTGQYFGFAARTGGANNNHWIKGLAVTKLGTNVSEYQIADVTAIQSAMYWDRVNSRLGIGAISPAAKLHVVAATASSPALVAKSSDNSSTNPILSVTNSSDVALFSFSANNQMKLGTNNGANQPSINFDYNTGTDVSITQVDNGKLSIFGANVGINEGNPTQRLQVAGNILVQTGGSGGMLINRGSTSDSAYIEYWTGGTNRWVTGLRNDGTNDFHVYNQSLSESAMKINITTGEVVFNEAGTDRDLRVEGDNNTNLLFVDAGTDRVGIATASPGSRLTVKGTTTDNTASSLNVTNSSDASLFFVRNDGYVGIGTASPNNQLVIANTADAVYAFLQGTGDTYNYSGLILASDEATDKNWGILHSKSPTANRFMIQEYDGSNYNGRFYIEPGGNTGINNGDPAYSLDVTGDANVSNAYRQGGTNVGINATCTGGQFIQNPTISGGIVTAGACNTVSGANPTLQDAYNNSSSPATITTTSAAKTITFKAGATYDSTSFFQIQNGAGTSNLFIADTTNNRIGIGINNPSYRLQVQQDMADTSGFLAMQYNQVAAVPASSSSATYIATRNVALTGSGLAQNITGSLIGLYNESIHQGTSTVSAAYGLQSNMKLSAAGTISQGVGAYLSTQVTAAGTIVSGAGLYVANPSLSGGGAITGFAGIVVEDIAAATNNTALLLGTSSLPGGNYSLYSASANDSYFAGDLGIGTNNPTSKLHVSGGTGSVNVLIAADSDDTNEADQPSITLTQDNGSTLGYFGFFDSTNVLTLYGGSGSDLRLGSGNRKEDLFIQASNGDVGINDTTPSYKLDVNGSVRATGAMYANANGALYFQGGDDASFNDINVANTVGINGVQNAAVASIKLGTGGATISGFSGRIGIGTTGPNYLLDVQGGDINASGVYRSGGTAGVARTCGAGQYLQSQTTVGGIVTGGTCTSVSGGGSFVNLQASTPGTQQTGHLNISGTGLFDTSVMTPLITTGTLTDLNINPTLNTIIIGSSTSSLYAALEVQNSATTTLLYVQNDGNVGINDSSPSYDLDVTGDINATGVYRAGGTAGVARTCSGGQYLLNQTTVGGIVTGGTCTAAPGSNFVTLQASTPGTADTGHFNISGTGIAGTSLQSPLLKTADRTSSGTSTALEVLSGNGTVPGANSGTLTLHSGDSTTSGNTGNTTLKSGDASMGNSGTLTLSSGAAGGSTGAVTLNSGHASNPSSTSGNMNVYTGNSTTSGNTGYISMRTGAASNGSTGAVTIYSGLASAMSATSGAISLYSGNTDAPSSNTGAVSLISGNSISSGDTGTAILRTGNAASGSSGTITINSGTAGGSTETTGNISIYTGNNGASISGNTGTLSLYTGASTSTGNSGAVSITTGNATSGNSGDLSLNVGTASGTKGTINIGTTNPTAAINVGATGSANVASTINVGTTTGATQLIHLGSTGSGNAAAGTTVHIQGGTTANNAIELGTNGAGGITIDTGTTGAILIGAGTGNNAKTITLGPTATKTSTTTFQIGINTAGAEIIQLGSASTGNAHASTTVNIQGGTTANTAVVIGTNGAGGITIDSGTTGNVNIANGANAKAVTVGSTTTGAAATLQASGGSVAISTAGNVTITGVSNGLVTVGNTGLGGLGVNLVGPTYTTATRGISVGTSDGNITLLNLDLSNQTTAETAGNCSTSINPGGIYYSGATTTNGATTQGIRGCINGAWKDIVAADQMGLLLLGVVEDSGSNPGDIGSISGIANGPCKVSWASSTSVSVAPCIAYSQGRKVVIPSAQTVTTINGNTLWYHICLNGTNGAPTRSTGNASQMATLPAFSATAPVLCLASVKTGASSTITNIYDTRVFVSSEKQFSTFTSGDQTGVAPGMLAVADITNDNRVTVTTTIEAEAIRGIVGVGSPSNSTSAVNVILVTNGMANALTDDPTDQVPGQWLVTGNVYYGYGWSDTLINYEANYGIVLANGSGAACNASTNCQFSILVDLY